MKGKHLYICDIEPDTWEVRSLQSDEVLAVIIRWADCWEVRERDSYESTNVTRFAIRDAVWIFVMEETVKRAEKQRPVNSWVSLEGLARPRKQEKEEMPVWLL